MLTLLLRSNWIRYSLNYHPGPHVIIVSTVYSTRYKLSLHQGHLNLTILFRLLCVAYWFQNKTYCGFSFKYFMGHIKVRANRTSPERPSDAVQLAIRTKPYVRSQSDVVPGPVNVTLFLLKLGYIVHNVILYSSVLSCMRNKWTFCPVCTCCAESIHSVVA